MLDKQKIAELRHDYAGEELSETAVARDPIVQFGVWFEEALNADVFEPNAMTVSTVDATCFPSARVVLLKGFDEQGFVFFTNYDSRKAQDLSANPNVTISFFWKELERQVIISGRAGKTSREESVNYFHSRPVKSQLSAWASRQSSVIDSRKQLEDKIEELSKRFGDEIPCPPFWGGFRIVPRKVEFWQGRPSRLHDRICYELINSGWRIFRLSP